MDLSITHNLTSLAEQINQEHEAVEAAFRAGVQHAITAGNLLIEAKTKIQHGGWADWLKANVRFSERTAQAYMKVAREVPVLGNEKAQRVADLSFRETLALLAEPVQSSNEPPLPSSLTQEEKTQLEALEATIESKMLHLRSYILEMATAAKEVESKLTLAQFRQWLHEAFEQNFGLPEYLELLDLAKQAETDPTWPFTDPTVKGKAFDFIFRISQKWETSG